MTSALETRLIADVLRVRIAQLLINEKLKAREFRVPVHLAMGHEAIASAVSNAMAATDSLLCTHRNIHYNLVRATSFRAELDELALSPNGVAQGTLGSMNMTNPRQGLIYTSSILGNNMCVAVGSALAGKLSGDGSAAFAITGDGAMEEGVFYESLQLAKSWEAPLVLVIENNDWSLATRTHERRCPIVASALAESLDVPHVDLTGNDVAQYHREIARIRSVAVETSTPVLVEVDVTTLGSWIMQVPDLPDGKFINYHHGGSPSVSLETAPLLAEDDTDPVHVLMDRYGKTEVLKMAHDIRKTLEEELS